jgi:hypothetical protein
LERAIVFIVKAASHKYPSVTPAPKETYEAAAAAPVTNIADVQDPDASERAMAVLFEQGKGDSHEEDKLEEDKGADLGSFWD